MTLNEIIDLAYKIGYEQGRRDKHRPKTPDNPHTIPAVVDMVCRFYEIKPDAILSKTRRREIVWARHVAMVLVGENSRLSVTSIGRYFQRDHTTVLHARKAVRDLCDTNEVLRGEVMELSAAILAKREPVRIKQKPVIVPAGTEDTRPAAEYTNLSGHLKTIEKLKHQP